MLKELVHQLAQELIGWRARFDPNLAEIIRPLRHAFIYYDNVEITLFTKLRDGGVDNLHLLLGERFVDTQLDFRTVLCQALPNLGQVVPKHRDASLYFAFVITIVEPLALTVVTNLQVAQVFELRIQEFLKQGVFSPQFLEGLLGHVDGSLLVGLTLFKFFGFVKRHGYELRKERLIPIPVKIFANPSDIGFEEFAPRLQSGDMLVFKRHDFHNGRKVLLPALLVTRNQVVGHELGGLLRIGKHGRQMSARQVGVGVVADTGTVGQQKGIGRSEPVESLASENGYSFAPIISRSLTFQHPIELVVEDVFADQPAPIIGKTRQVLELPGEQLVMIDVVSVLGLAQLPFQRGGIVLAQRSRNPVQQKLALLFAWLSLFLFRGHVPEEGLLLHPV